MKLIVDSCKTCPFVRDYPVLGGLLRLLSGNEQPTAGLCSYSREHGVVNPRLGLPPGPERELEMSKFQHMIKVEDRDKIPEACPLRVEPVTVSLGS